MSDFALTPYFYCRLHFRCEYQLCSTTKGSGPSIYIHYRGLQSGDQICERFLMK